MVHPIIDEYYNPNPYHSRSSKFVNDKGLITNEKPAAVGSSPSTSPAPAAAQLHQSLAHNVKPAAAILSRREDYNPNADIRHTTPPSRSATTTPRSQEQGNTKKKRVAAPPVLAETPDMSAAGTSGVDFMDTPEGPQTRNNEPRNKLSQYFPELG